jgi:iron complex transport system substrate-binding protein
VAALGALDRLAGVSHECDWPHPIRALPRLTRSRIPAAASACEVDQQVRDLTRSGVDLFALDIPLLRHLAPDLIITQSLCDVCAVSEEDVRAAAAALPHACNVLSLGATTLDDVFTSVRAVADALEEGEAGGRLLDTLTSRLTAVSLGWKNAGATARRVAVIEWADPLFTAGHWVPEMVHHAGGIDVVATPGEHSRTRHLAELVDAAPEVLVFAPCGYDLDRSCHEATALLADAAWMWATHLETWAIDGNALSSRPGPRLCDGVETLAAMFHPDLFDFSLAGRARRVPVP